MGAKRKEFRAAEDHPDCVCGIFFRKSPKAKPKLTALVTGGLLAALIYQVGLAKKLKVPLRKIEVVAYWANREAPGA